jgi:glycosyltransferase involved in cell wall biosynthesis
MATEAKLIIGYSGSLAFYEGKYKRRRNSWTDWFWTYNYYSTDPSTRSASYLFRAVALLAKSGRIHKGDLLIDLWGNIASDYKVQAAELGIADFVRIDGYLPKTESLKRTEQCDVLYLPMESPTNLGKPLFIPGKAFEYMQAGKTILALSYDCDCIDILKPSGLLAVFTPKSENEIADWIEAMIRNEDKRSGYSPNPDYISRFAFRNITAQVAGVFDELLKR